MFDDEDDYDFEDPIGPTVPARERAEWFIRTAVLFESFLAFVAIGLGWAVGVAPWISASWNSGSITAILGAMGLGALATVPLLAAFMWLQHTEMEGLDDLNDYMERQIVPLFREATVIELLLISLAAGIGEEALFRGVIQTFLQEIVGSNAGPAVPIILTSLLFGVVHFMTKEYFIISGLMGAYLGIWFWWTGDLIVPIVIHALYDWFALVYLRQSTPEEDDTASE
ncbi:type II CAAX endopeptidase family protein [Bremerella sp. JC817]|uniref:CPBP family intramembrane glutamic endopeptidase n=1 Tax=Bremerella sp. JC817 TaxID=3231756 RepID=UPI0034577D3C